MHDVTVALLCAALVGLALVAAQVVVLRRHVRGPVAVGGGSPPISILKPLCGIDDALEANLASFADLPYPAYEVVLGVASVEDPVWAVARAAARRWPHRFRVALQRGAPGQNPKVNQLLTLARAARHDLLVISDSNVRVEPGYLAEIAALLGDPHVGLVTHPIVGVGEQTLGSRLDCLHLASAVTPGMVAALRVAGRPVVVGKSMAMRRADLEAIGGFAVVKDVLAEDYVMGTLVTTALQKRVAVATRAVQNVTERRTVEEFAARYRRWAVLQRQAAGPVPYAAMVLLNPVLLATVAVIASRTRLALAGLAVTCLAKAALDGAAVSLLRRGGFGVAQLALSPLKDLVFGTAWAYGLVRRDVNWRGHRLVVRRGTYIDPAPSAHEPSEVPGGVHGAEEAATT